MNIYDLASFMKTAHKVVDEEWKKLGPDKRKRICDNLTKRAMERIKRKEENAGRKNEEPRRG